MFNLIIGCCKNCCKRELLGGGGEGREEAAFRGKRHEFPAAGLRNDPVFLKCATAPFIRFKCLNKDNKCK